MGPLEIPHLTHVCPMGLPGGSRGTLFHDFGPLWTSFCEPGVHFSMILIPFGRHFKIFWGLLVEQSGGHPRSNRIQLCTTELDMGAPQTPNVDLKGPHD